jgi:hypothetical protein
MENIVHVALAPLDTPDESLVVKVAAIINKDVYGTRLLIAGKIPRFVAHCQTIHDAKLAVGQHVPRTLTSPLSTTDWPLVVVPNGRSWQ